MSEASASLQARAVDVARLELRRRRRRDEHFPTGLFADPAWDMLLDLFVTQEEGRQLCVSSVCLAAAVPISTGLRHLRRLEDLALVQRRPDPTDARRAFVLLTDQAKDMMRRVLQPDGTGDVGMRPISAH
jgi:hypothetical protein